MAAVTNSVPFFSTLCLISISIHHLFVIPFLVEGFSVELVHRDHGKSTGEDSSQSHYQMLHDAFLRSFARKDFFKQQIKGSKQQTFSSMDADGSQAQIKSFITNAAGEYLMQVSIGTPPLTIMAIADTGSDLTWTQCEPCVQCYKQETPLFNPAKSYSYKKLPCNSPLCKETGQPGCDSSNSCTYQYSYGDGSSTAGDVSTETFTFGSNSGKNVSIPNIAFGCGHQNGGTFNRSGSGIVGLGGGKLSVVNQFGNVVNGKFSYCLVPFGRSNNVTSRISFGTSAIVSGKDTKSTPLYKGNPDTFYFLNLEGVSVIQGGRASGVGSGNNGSINAKRISVNKLSSTGVSTDSVGVGPGKPGNIVIDSGTTLTFLPRQLATDLEATLRESISGTAVRDSQGLFNLCYKTGQGIRFPDIVAHFTGADILLPTFNTFLQISDDLICLTLLGNDDLPIFGNLSQGDYHIGYDLVNGTVSFQQTDCSKAV
ncbi:OLC1v1010255C1 [Oldenlandia corymbosa var. corymbosa]|uniref:OLC1v1010255C1 n=1 Tax=Oldenlandia corymbosa var. corymbosa TaxID=529605 RepID=A0AAV1DQX2_OLDCO|nr:OLC1v1010255C1 [Oldenlandia corymbosa var. corymbosa]